MAVTQPVRAARVVVSQWAPASSSSTASAGLTRSWRTARFQAWHAAPITSSNLSSGDRDGEINTAGARLAVPHTRVEPRQ